MDKLNAAGLVMVGCGFMGQALLEGWLSNGLKAEAVFVQDPAPTEWLKGQSDLRLNEPLPSAPAAIVIATKPQILDKVLPGLAQFGNGTTAVISIAAGAPVRLYERHRGADTPVIRAMPNLPASVGQGATALYGNAAAAEHLAMANTLFSAVGTCVTLLDEEMMHLVTGLSGSGAAFVFAVVEAMINAAHDLGLPLDLASALAHQTVAGAGAMLAEPKADAEELRRAVTSKGGTTAAGLAALTPRLTPLIRDTVNAARERSLELSQ